MQKKDHPKIPLSRDRWLELALETLSEKGQAKFSLDALINAMPVSKGSFYHHFRNRADFLLALVDHWDRHETQNVIDALEALPEHVPAEERLWELMCVVHETHGVHHDLLIRSMALEFPEVRSRVRAVDAKRIGIVRRLFKEMGFSGDELETRVLTFVTTTSLYRLIYFEYSREDLRRLLKPRHEFFVGKP